MAPFQASLQGLGSVSISPVPQLASHGSYSLQKILILGLSSFSVLLLAAFVSIPPPSWVISLGLLLCLPFPTSDLSQDHSIEEKVLTVLTQEGRCNAA